MKIPKKFKLFGKTITVRFAPEEFVENDNVGFASYRRNEIQLKPSTESSPQNDEQIESTFWHEFSHFIIYYAGNAYSGKEEFMHQDEKFIELMGDLIHQAISTFEY